MNVWNATIKCHGSNLEVINVESGAGTSSLSQSIQAQLAAAQEFENMKIQSYSNASSYLGSNLVATLAGLKVNNFSHVG